MGRTNKGTTTIGILHLGDVVGKIQVHLGNALLPWMKEIETKKAAGDDEAVRDTWRTLCERLLNDAAVEFRGPCFWAMRHAWDRLGLAQFGCINPTYPVVRH